MRSGFNNELFFSDRFELEKLEYGNYMFTMSYVIDENFVLTFFPFCECLGTFSNFFLSFYFFFLSEAVFNIIIYF